MERNIASDDRRIRQLLANARTIAVVGLSADPSRSSHDVATYLMRHGYRVIPVNPMLPEVLGEKCYPSLKDVPEKIDIVDCFRKAEAIPPIVEEAIAVGAQCVWMQLGIVDEQSARRAEVAGLDVVMDRCLKVEHARLME